jgi:hypothetical protein
MAFFFGSDLTPSGWYYTDLIGGGLGPAVVTGGDVDAPNDNGFYGPIALGGTLRFFGQDFTTLFANNNGNITLGAGSAAFYPPTPPGFSVYYGDVDTTGPGSGLMHVREDPNEIIITWDQVGYAFGHDDLLNSFQLVVRRPGVAIPAGQGQIGFFFKEMEWDDADTRNPGLGFGLGYPAVGLGDGPGGNFLVLVGSTQPGIHQIVENSHVWFNLDAGGTPAVVPEPSAWLLCGIALAGWAWRRRR